MTFLTKELAGVSSDPLSWIGYLNQLPNPDPILKKMGIDQEVYKDIRADAHVMGELRAIRSGFLSFEQQIQSAGKNNNDKKALELCEKVLNNKKLKWFDLTWQIAESIFLGYRMHEIIWERDDRFLVPKQIKDVPNRRLVFDLESKPRLLTKRFSIEGERLEQYLYKFLLTRHMPEHENPYGLSLYSVCYWPYIFKHAGFKFFTKFIERFGNPLIVGKYKDGTDEKTQEELANKLQRMVEASIAVLPEESIVQLLEINGKGELHETFVNLMNREMSKALTSQTLATEIQNQGSRAASETHRGRERNVNQGDRQLVSDTFNLLFLYITELNYPDAVAPLHHFYEESIAESGWAKLFVDMTPLIGGSIPLSFVHEKLNIPIAKEGEKTLLSTNENNAIPTTPPPSSKKPDDKFEEYAQQNASELEKLVTQGSDEFAKVLPIYDIQQRLSESKNLDEFDQNLILLYEKGDKKKQLKQIENALIVAQLYALSEIKDEIEGQSLFSEKIEVGDLPFDEAIDFFKEKINIPTKNWYDLQREQHDLAFVIAGATQADLLNDMHNALSKSLETGSTLNDFRKNFDQMINESGWSYKGGRNWRTKIIFDTNMHSARASGKWEQYQKLKEERPYLRYVSVRDHRTRLSHASLHNTILPIDDDFWGAEKNTISFFPPLGYRCRCSTISYNDRQLESRNLQIADPKKVEKILRQIGSAWVTDPRTGEKKMLNKALTLGFDYAPGKYKDNLKQEILKKGSNYFPELKRTFLENFQDL